MANEKASMSVSIEGTVKKWKKGLQGLKLMTFAGSLILLGFILFFLTFLLEKEYYKVILQISMIVPIAIGLIIQDGSIFRSYYEKRTGYAEPRTGPFKNKQVLLIAAILFIIIIVVKFSFASSIYQQSSRLAHFLNIPYGALILPIIAIIFIFYGIIRKDFSFIFGAVALGILYIPLLFLHLNTYLWFSYSLFSIGLALFIPGIMYHRTYLELYKSAKNIEGEINVQE